MLRRHGVACVLADTAGRWPRVEQVTSDFVYVRLHGDKELYASGYTDEALDALGREMPRLGGRRARRVRLLRQRHQGVRAARRDAADRVAGVRGRRRRLSDYQGMQEILRLPTENRRHPHRRDFPWRTASPHG